MARLRINASTLVTKHVLEVTDAGIVWCESSLFGGKTLIPFKAVDAVLRGPRSLSLQVQRKIYKIPIKDDARHRAAIARLVAECRRTAPSRPRPVPAAVPAAPEAT